MQSLHRIGQVLPLFKSDDIPKGSAVLVAHTMFVRTGGNPAMTDAELPQLILGLQWMIVLGLAKGERSI